MALFVQSDLQPPWWIQYKYLYNCTLNWYHSLKVCYYSSFVQPSISFFVCFFNNEHKLIEQGFFCTHIYRKSLPAIFERNAPSPIGCFHWVPEFFSRQWIAATRQLGPSSLLVSRCFKNRNKIYDLNLIAIIWYCFDCWLDQHVRILYFLFRYYARAVRFSATVETKYKYRNELHTPIGLFVFEHNSGRLGRRCC